MPNQHGTRSRKYVSVVHNITLGNKTKIITKIGETYPLLYYALAEEEYSAAKDAGKHHMHLQLQFQNPVSKTKLLKLLEKIVPRDTSIDEQTLSKKGRIQIDIMRGTIEQATQYLIDPKKKKLTDELPNLCNFPTNQMYLIFPRGEEIPNYIIEHHINKYHEQMPYIPLDMLRTIYQADNNYNTRYLNPHYIKPRKKAVKDNKPISIDWAKHARTAPSPTPPPLLFI